MCFLKPDPHVKTLSATWAFYRVFALFDGESESRTAVLAFSVAADLAVTDLVTLKCKEVLYSLPYADKLSVFFSAFVNVL